jgi:DNA helicase HerA-like ATPase
MTDMSASSDFVSTIQQGYATDGEAILLGAAVRDGTVHPDAQIRLPLRTMNRHGLISGATGTGKTYTLALIAEQLSEAGVPVLLMDIKGDLSGIAAAGVPNPKITERHARLGIDWSPTAYPVEFLTISNEPGIRLRATVIEFGPILFSRILGLNETQSSLVALVFKFCDDKSLPLLDLKDFKKVLEYITGPAKANVTLEYGLVPASSAGLILRKLIELEQQGADLFFGERSFEIEDLCRTDGGFGVISILRLADIQSRPKLFSSFMLQMLGELFATFPEAGDLEKPKLVVFIDEAHLLFDEASKELIDQVETVIKLVRSKGVGLFFCTQMPADLPDAILNQLGMKVQHALRAFTAKDRKELKLVAENYPETKFYETAELLTQLGIGEALVTVLNESGVPTPLAATLLAAPRSRIGPVEPTEIKELVSRSSLAGKYNEPLDSRSAYEILGGKVAAAAASQGRGSASARRTYSPTASRPTAGDELADALGRAPGTEPMADGLPYPAPKAEQPGAPNVFEQLMKSTVTKAVARSVAVAIAGTVTRSLLGVMGMSGRRRR